jgi:hypothetical protein
MDPDFFEFRSFNLTDHFIRHRNFLGELTPKEGPSDDFLFLVEQRGQQGLVALRSKNFPNRFLRHRDSRIRLERPGDPNPELFEQDTSFFLVRGLADPNGVSFESLNPRGHFIRHSNLHLVLDRRDTLRLAEDGTFFKQPPSVLIDHGPDLVPVSG